MRGKGRRWALHDLHWYQVPLDDLRFILITSVPTLHDDHLSHRHSTLARPIGAIQLPSHVFSYTPGFMTQVRVSST